MCVDMGDRQVLKTLETVLNAEVSLKTGSEQKDLLGEYKNQKHAIDPNVLAQPEFQFSPAGVKLTKI